jgi:hypothetical protein
VKPDDPAFNDNVMYAKCVKGHVLRSAGDWIQCENLPAPDAQCWQEGGDTLFTLLARKRSEANATPITSATESEKIRTTPTPGALPDVPKKATSQSGKS